MSRNTKRAIAKYGRAVCERCYAIHQWRGEGASSIALGYNIGARLTTNQIDAAINAGRELATEGETK